MKVTRSIKQPSSAYAYKLCVKDQCGTTCARAKPQISCWGPCSSQHSYEDISQRERASNHQGSWAGCQTRRSPSLQGYAASASRPRTSQQFPGPTPVEGNECCILTRRQSA